MSSATRIRATAIGAALGALALLPASAGAATPSAMSLRVVGFTVKVDPQALPPALSDAVVGEDGLIRLRLEGKVVTLQPRSLPASLERALRAGLTLSLNP